MSNIIAALQSGRVREDRIGVNRAVAPTAHGRNSLNLKAATVGYVSSPDQRM
jgi:hypothetical protein